jgi:HlyD family secretion protein
VFAVDGETIRVQTVVIGERNGISAEILDKLSAGDVVVVHPPDTLGDGARVTRR